jgi:hypothetical protein
MKKKPVNDAVNAKTVMAILWITLMILYAYCDILSLYRPGQLQTMLDGKMGFLPVTQATLLVSSALMIVPTLMALMNVLVSASIARVANIVASACYFAVCIGNVVSETWTYYLLFGVIELAVVAIICFRAVTWPTVSAEPDKPDTKSD